MFVCMSLCIIYKAIGTEELNSSSYKMPTNVLQIYAAFFPPP